MEKLRKTCTFQYMPSSPNHMSLNDGLKWAFIWQEQIHDDRGDGSFIRKKVEMHVQIHREQFFNQRIQQHVRVGFICNTPAPSALV